MACIERRCLIQLGNDRRHRLFGALLAGSVFALALAVYLRTLTPGLGGGIDSAELQHAAWNLSIVHPTGYPLYLLLARGFIALVPVGDVAWRVNLVSALCAAGAVTFVYLAGTLLTRERLAGLLAAALVATHTLVWQQATVAEVNSLNLLLVAALIVTLLRWADVTTAGWRPPLELAGLLAGLALANHRVSLLLLPWAALFVVWSARAGVRVSRGTLARALGCGLLPLLLYLYIPLRAYTTPWYTNDWQGFWTEVSGESMWPIVRETLRHPLLPRVRLVVESIVGDLRLGVPRDANTGGLLLLGGLGLLALTVRRWWGEPLARRAVVALLAPAALVVSAVMVVYDVDVIGDYLSMAVLLVALLAATGYETAIRWLSSQRTLTAHAVPVVFALLLGVVAWHGWSTLPEMDRSEDRAAEAFWEPVLALEDSPARLERDAFVIGTWNQRNEMIYLQTVDDWRPDLQPVVAADIPAGQPGLIDEWLAQGRAVYLLDPAAAILDRYLVDPQGTIWRISGAAEQADVPLEHALGVRFGDDIELLGYTLRPESPAPGEQLRITLFWRAAAPIAERYVVFTHLLDSSGQLRGQRDDEPGHGERPTTGWTPGETISDTLVMSLSADLSPGRYRLMVGLYARIGEKRLPVTGPAGEPLGDYWQMTEIEVRR